MTHQQAARQRLPRTEHPDRRAALRAGAGGALGIATLALPAAAAAASPLVPAASSAATGTAEDPILVGTLDDLAWIAGNAGRLGLHYRQAADIDASATAADVTAGGAGFSPIGSTSTPFTGGFDGNGFTITGLTIDATGTEHVGMFGTVNGATLTRIVLLEVTVVGLDRVGSLAGSARELSDVTHCHATGSVTSQDQYAGGLIGSVFHGPLIQDCSAAITVTGLGAVGNRGIGGLVGTFESGNVAKVGRLSRCVATGDVTGTNGVGGLVGWMRGNCEITDSYATGAVTRSSGTETEIGGLLGSTDATNTIARSYATGAVTYTGATDPTSKGFVGGTRGTPSSPTYTANHFDSDTSGQSSGTGATAQATAAMRAQATFTGWDFDAVWTIDAAVNGGRPTLRTNPPR